MEEQKTELKMIRMSEVESQEVKWLWYPFIPYGKLTIIQGDPGDGKTTLVLNIAAKASGNKSYTGTLFVEDRVAYDFLSIILEDKAPYILKKYTIDVAEGGEKAITYRLEFPSSDKIKYNFIGIYDGDMRERLDTSKLNWKWLFLPGNKALEELYREYLHVPENLEKFCEIVGKEKKQIITMLATIDGNDYHDWFEELRKFLGIDGKMLVRNFYRIMQEMDKEIEEFIAELKKSIA